jgi:alpha-D-ribose 1-methylphosphonate 5-triphosphate synthase subunit PhnI
VAVLQDHRTVLEAEDRAAEAGVGVLDDQVQLGVNDRDLAAWAAAAGEHIGVIAIHVDRAYRRRRIRAAIGAALDTGRATRRHM